MKVKQVPGTCFTGTCFTAAETLKENLKTLKGNLKNGKEKGALSIVHRVFNN